MSYGGSEWSYRRMILHYATLCDAAGGVDCFLVGSEMRGLTALSDGFASHPFVDDLVALAGDVKSVLGPATEVSYAADWTEWANHRPVDGSGDVTFHLDPFWASPDIDFVGIDAYLPLADWREGDHADAAIADAPSDRAYLAGNVAGGENFDWFYASEADRAAGLRTPITDGAAGKPWTFRVKDLAGWWGNLHHDRPGGVESPVPTAWVPGLKPIRFTEVGCPAVDNGANEPNVFPDLVSSEGRSPRFSRGRRDDLMQRRYLEAMLGHFDPGHPDFTEEANPVSPLDGRRMADWRGAHVWTWDARPYPAFPVHADVWADGANWNTGHWLNGRLGAAPLDDLVAAVLADHGVAGATTDGLGAVIDGLVVPGRSSAREILEPLATLFRFDVIERGGTLVFRDRGGRAVAGVGEGDLVEEERQPLFEVTRTGDGEVPAAVTVAFLDGGADYLQTSVAAGRAGGDGARALDLSLPVVAAPAAMAGYAEALLKDLDAARERVTFALPPAHVGIEPGDRLSLAIPGLPDHVVVARIEEAEAIRIEARACDPSITPHAAAAPVRTRASAAAGVFGPPRVAILDLPGGDPGLAHRPRIAAAARPWPGTLGVHRAAGGGFVHQQSLDRPATMGRLTAPLGPGPLWRFDRVSSIEVALLSGTLASVTEAELLDGGNAAAIGTSDGAWEIIQFRDADLIGPRTYRLSHLLRGLLGTGDVTAGGHGEGATFVLVDAAVAPLDVALSTIGRGFTLRVGPLDRDVGDASMAEVTATVRGRGLRPLPPVRLTARRVAGGDIAIGWIRQTRVGGDAWEQVEVPLGEDTEAYAVDVMAGADVVRTLASASPSVVYTAAAQSTDFGAPPASLTIVVHQLSATHGRGLPATASFSF
ncbi:hypothetical protein A6302_00189 [Methylobrevis pamukkalensis]|uniref:Phage tail protein n=1 Tax=Methylobrevis pamukkalensis TaxID=1439726 RepID=A0A1E3H804_9HYPH|nr:hypothetical protein A6302_00189 [Methylobrevis pamukkalensis]